MICFYESAEKEINYRPLPTVIILSHKIQNINMLV